MPNYFNPESLFPTTGYQDIPIEFRTREYFNKLDAAKSLMGPQSELMDLGLQRERMSLEKAQANLPVEEAQRQSALLKAKGESELFPLEQTRRVAEARYKGSPEALDAERKVYLSGLTQKLRDADWSKIDQEAKLAARHFKPVLDAYDKKDYAGASQALEEAYSALQKYGIDVSQFRNQPLPQVIGKLKQAHDFAVYDIPLVRDLIKQEKKDVAAMERTERTAEASEFGSRARAGATIRAAEIGRESRWERLPPLSRAAAIAVDPNNDNWTDEDRAAARYEYIKDYISKDRTGSIDRAVDLDFNKLTAEQKKKIDNPGQWRVNRSVQLAAKALQQAGNPLFKDLKLEGVAEPNKGKPRSRASVGWSD